MKRAVLLAMCVFLGAVVTGCGGGSDAGRFVDQESKTNPNMIAQACVEIAQAKQIGGLLSYYNGFASQYEKTVAGTNAPPARDVFREIRQRCDNPTG